MSLFYACSLTQDICRWHYACCLVLHNGGLPPWRPHDSSSSWIVHYGLPFSSIPQTYTWHYQHQANWSTFLGRYKEAWQPWREQRSSFCYSPTAHFSHLALVTFLPHSFGGGGLPSFSFSSQHSRYPHLDHPNTPQGQGHQYLCLWKTCWYE